MKRNITKRLGFTLIELLFVIAIIGVLASIGMTLSKQQAQKTKIEKTALQIQQILQAGQSYYADNKCLPDDNSVAAPVNPILSGCTNITNPPAFSNYLPIGSTNASGFPIGPWGNVYKWGTTADKSKFRVCTEATGPVGLLTSAIANRIAGLLPNALTLSSGAADCSARVATETCSGTNCIVASEVNKLGAGASGANPMQLGGYVLKIGQIPDPTDPRESIVLPDNGQDLNYPVTGLGTCASGYTLVMSAYPKFYHVAYNKISTTLLSPANIMQLSVMANSCNTQNASCDLSITFQQADPNQTGSYSPMSALHAWNFAMSKPYARIVTNDGQLVIGYIAMCMP